MFTGIIEALGTITAVQTEGTNIHFTVSSALADTLKIDQSVSHNGVCLTVVETGANWHVVTAVEETLLRTNLGSWQVGTLVNLERCMQMNGRLDGHIVQGHVDTKANCVGMEDRMGSWLVSFKYEPNRHHLLVDKGSVCINGVSLTVVQPHTDIFSVAIIPYTWEHTNFHQLALGDQVNIEFDILGKYVTQYLALYGKS